MVPQNLNVGDPTVIISKSPSQPIATTFEDDGETGYFYAVSLADENRILDAMHLYNVASVSDRQRQHEIEIVWSADGVKSALLINQYPHAVFDFAEKRGYCRTGFPNFPPSTSSWKSENHDWDDSVMQRFEIAGLP